MPIPKTILNALGSWKGTSTLNLTHLPEAERIRKSESTLNIKQEPHGQYARLSYVWEEDGPQYGDMIICGNEGEAEVTVGWSDSWHQNTSVMHLAGGIQEDGSVSVLGSYGSPQWGDWGWRIVFENATPDRFLLKMFNISPEGEEEWAVLGEYERA